MGDTVRGKSVLVTGGTGSFGRKFVEIALKARPKRLVVYSRDEYKQHQMQRQFDHPAMRYFIGDVRDADRLRRAMHGIDVVVHAAALKQVPAIEYNPFEAVKTNIVGAENVINAAIDCRVPKVVALSSDKAVNPINMYGATKLCADKMFVAGNSYAGAERTVFGVVRYGNVIGSRGSVVEVFKRLRENGTVPVTDERMTRFWITLEQGVRFVMAAIRDMRGGEIFVPKIPSMRILDLVKAVAPGRKIRIIGIRPGEKLHEVLLTEDDASHTVEQPDRYVILPEFFSARRPKGRKVPPQFRYSSDKNTSWLTVKELVRIVGD